MYLIYIYIYVTYIYIHTHVYIYIYTYLCMYRPSLTGSSFQGQGIRARDCIPREGDLKICVFRVWGLGVAGLRV